MKKSVSLLVVLLLSSCVSGPEEKGRTVADRLNGENYSRTDNIGGVPVLERKPALRTLSGRAFCGTGLSQSPVNHAAIQLFDGDNAVASASTDSGGSYLIRASLEVGVVYRLTASAKCGSASTEFPMDGKSVTLNDLFLVK